MNASENQLPKSFRWLNATQFFGALNDNLLKLLIVFFLISLQGPEQATTIAATAGAVFVAPFLLLSAPAGALADRFSKCLIIRAMKLTEMVIALVAILSFSLGSSSGLYGVLLLMAAQSALFGPAKYGILPEMVERRQLSRANSLIEMLTYLAIILGSALAPLLAQVSQGNYRNAALACIAFSLAGTLSSLKIEKTRTAERKTTAGLLSLRELRATVGELRQDGYLLLAIIGSAYFLFLGAFAQINLIPFGMQVHGLTQEQSGYLFLVAALGIGSGSYLAGRLSGRNIEFGVVPLGAMGLSLATCGLFLLPDNLLVHSVLLLGVSGGLFLVPLHAFVQYRAPREKLGRILAAGSILSWCGVLLASALSWLLSGPFGFSAAQSFLLLGLLTCGLTLITLYILPDFLLRFIALLVMKLAYRIELTGADNVPEEGPALLVANHVSWVDALLLLATQQRRIRFIMHRDIYNVRLLRPLFRLMGIIPVAAGDSRKQKIEFVRSARKALDDGYLVCIFAEGMITRNGMLQPFKSGFEAILKGTGHPLVPVHIGGAWGSIFSYANGRMLSKLPTSFPYFIAIDFGSPLPADSNANDVQREVAELACAYFQRRQGQRTSLAEMFIATARDNWKRPAISDSSGKSLNYGKTLTAALLLAKQLKPELADERNIALLVPPSLGGALVNLALPLLGKVPVNLNYSASVEAMQSAVDQCAVRTIITSRRFCERLPHLPQAARTFYLEDLLSGSDKREQLQILLKARFWPKSLLLRQPRHQGGRLATIIFSSGSTGEPKGVMLSQHNIISNLEAIRTVAALSPQDNVCSALPFFHALGYTATLWLPLLSGFSACYHVNPLDAPAITKLVKRHRSTLLLTTPTFLATYMRRASKEDFASLRLVVTGAEKLKTGVADSFAEKYGLRPLEGYGATELAPLITLSLPDLATGPVTQQGNRVGSVGRAVPGVVLRIVDPESREPLPTDTNGLILVKGPNLMRGYLHRPDKTSEAIVDGWYVTGDIGHLDSDGFLHITDRLARFSKIGGEMVPHIRVEEAFYDALKLDGNALAVTSIADSRKGEKLVVIYTEEAGDIEKLRQVSSSSDLPNLWRPHPDNFVKVDRLPLLGSGKLDLSTLRKIAEQQFAS